MRSLISDKADLTPYTAVVPTLVSMRMDFPQEDRDLMNHAVWYASTGFARPYPGESRVLLPAEVTRGPVNWVSGRDD